MLRWIEGNRALSGTGAVLGPSSRAAQVSAELRLMSRPAYSREVTAARRAGETPNIHVHVGTHAWERAKAWGVGHRIVVPLDLDRCPTDFDFGCLYGLSVVLNATDSDLIVARQVAVAIVEQGAQLVALLHPDLTKNSEFFYGAHE